MQFIDLKTQYTMLKEEINIAIQNVLNHGQYIMGKEVEEFEKSLSDYIGVKHAISCANGTDALQMLYMAYNVGPGDAVFCSDITFMASVEPACMLGATPVFCDIDKDTYNICPKSLRSQIEAVLKEGKLLPKIVLAVDILGNPAEYDELFKICNEYDLILIEDAAQSFGAEYKGKKCGTFGKAAITSFFPAKPLGCYGDGGAIFTNDDELADILYSIRIHGKGTSKYDNIRIGVNSRLDTIQAAILQVKLKAFIEYEIDNRQKVARIYDEAFGSFFKTPYVTNENQSIYAQYVLLANSTLDRDKIIKYLSNNEIPNMIYYPTPQHELPVYRQYKTYNEEFVNAKYYCAHTFSIPMHPYLNMGEQELIISKVKEAII